VKESTISNHVNPNPTCNCTHIAAWGMAAHISKWGWHNVRYMFKPLNPISIVIVPQEFTPEDEQFEPSMFRTDGTFYTTPLNHYIKVQLEGVPAPILINAGLLINNWLRWPETKFWKAIKTLIKEAKQQQKDNPLEGEEVLLYGGKI